MAELIKQISEEELVFDKKKFFLVLVLLLLVIGGTYFAKVLVLDKQEKRQVSQAKKTSNEGKVAGITVEDKEFDTLQEDFRNKVEEIKKDISELRPEDVVKQEPVQKIIQDLENLKTTSGSKITEETKNAVCEQAKKFFCSQ